MWCNESLGENKLVPYLRAQWLEIEGGVDWRQQGRDAAVGKGADGGGDDARERRRGLWRRAVALSYGVRRGGGRDFKAGWVGWVGRRGEEEKRRYGTVAEEIHKQKWDMASLFNTTRVKSCSKSRGQ